MQQAARTRLRCANCQIIIRWLPTLVEGHPYCCAGCADGGPYTCDYSHLPETMQEYAIVLHDTHTRVSSSVYIANREALHHV
jgi:hypothetical protein